jgi:GT2 family glycosyltransferase
VDNASTDGTVAAVSAEHHDVHIVANAANEGFTRAVNQGLRYLRVLDAPGRTDPKEAPAPKVVVLLNPDTQIVGDALSELADYLDAHPCVAVAGPGLLWPNGAPQHSRRRFPTVATGLAESTPLAWHWPRNPVVRHFLMEGSAEAAGPVDWLRGAVLAVRTTPLREIGGLDERFFMYSEEIDLCRRLADAGWQTHYVPSARVIHHEGQSSEQAVLARHLHFQRSRVRYFRKHHGIVAAAAVRAGIVLGYSFEVALEAAKLAMGHRASLRRQRLTTYRAVLADQLSPRLGRRDRAA